MSKAQRVNVFFHDASASHLASYYSSIGYDVDSEIEARRFVVSPPNAILDNLSRSEDRMAAWHGPDGRLRGVGFMSGEGYASILGSTVKSQSGLVLPPTSFYYPEDASESEEELDELYDFNTDDGWYRWYKSVSHWYTVLTVSASLGLPKRLLVAALLPVFDASAKLLGARTDAGRLAREVPALLRRWGVRESVNDQILAHRDRMIDHLQNAVGDAGLPWPGGRAYVLLCDALLLPGEAGSPEFSTRATSGSLDYVIGYAREIKVSPTMAHVRRVITLADVAFAVRLAYYQNGVPRDGA